MSLKPEYDDLKAVFLDIAAVKGKPNEIDTTRLGNWIKRYKERIVNGYRLEIHGKKSDRVQWAVVPA